MKKIVLTSLAALLLANAAHAGAYVSGYLSTVTDSEEVWHGNDRDNEVGFLDTLNLDLTVGYAFANGLRVEADIFTSRLYVDNNADFSDNLTFGFGLGAVKGLYDVAATNGFTPYFGAGLTNFGWSTGVDTLDRIEFDVVGVVGVKYAISSQFSLDLQYNRTFTYDSRGDALDADYNGQNVFKLGGVYKF